MKDKQSMDNFSGKKYPTVYAEEEKKKTLEQVREYYGKVIKTKNNLQTTACCTANSMPTYLVPILKTIHQDVKDTFYGCGTPFPFCLNGLTVLDLGSGSGQDCYMLSKLVGATGKVIGVDMTEEQIGLAKKYQEYHAEKFDHSTSNIRFLKGFIEDLTSLNIEPNSVDLVVSNCVINLSPDKERVFREIFRVLKPGGELYFSDVYADRRIPKEIQQDKVLYGECLAGALYVGDFHRIVHNLGCRDIRTVEKTPFGINNAALERKIGMIQFYSITHRCFKLDLEDACEDYGQVAYYKGSIEENPYSFTLDAGHVFPTGQPVLVCGNTADMLSKTRYRKHFHISGEKDIHYGIFQTAEKKEMNSIHTSCC